LDSVAFTISEMLALIIENLFAFVAYASNVRYNKK